MILSTTIPGFVVVSLQNFIELGGHILQISSNQGSAVAPGDFIRQDGHLWTTRLGRGIRRRRKPLDFCCFSFIHKHQLLWTPSNHPKMPASTDQIWTARCVDEPIIHNPRKRCFQWESPNSSTIGCRRNAKCPENGVATLNPVLHHHVSPFFHRKPAKSSGAQVIWGWPESQATVVVVVVLVVVVDWQVAPLGGFSKSGISYGTWDH